MKQFSGKSLLKIVFSAEFIALISFLVYVLTLAPGVYGFDSAELATGVYSLGIIHPPGYPLYMFVGKLFTLLPVGSFAYRLNLMSAFFAALTIYFLFKVIFILSKKQWIAWVASAFLSFSIYFWQMAVVAEVYTLHTFFLALELFILLTWREKGDTRLLILFAFLYGLSLTNHTSGLLFAPGFAWLLFTSPGWKWKFSRLWAEMVGAFLAAMLLYLYLPLRAHAGLSLNYLEEYYSVDVTTLSGFLWMVSGKAYQFFAFGYPLSEMGRELWNGLELLWRNFMGVGALFAFLGLVVSMKKNWKNGTAFLLLFLGNFVFYINYRVMDKDTMFLPAFLAAAIFTGFGLAFVNDFICEINTSANLKKLADSLQLVFWIGMILMSLIFNWQWADMSQTLGPETYCLTIMNSAEKNSTIIASWSPAVVLEYFQVVEGRRPDLHIYNQSRREVARYYQYWSTGMPEQAISTAVFSDELAAVNRLYDEGPVYSIEYDPAIAGSYEYLPIDTYYRLEKKITQ